MPPSARVTSQSESLPNSLHFLKFSSMNKREIRSSLLRLTPVLSSLSDSSPPPAYVTVPHPAQPCHPLHAIPLGCPCFSKSQGLMRQPGQRQMWSLVGQEGLSAGQSWTLGEREFLPLGDSSAEDHVSLKLPIVRPHGEGLLQNEASE